MEITYSPSPTNLTKILISNPKLTLTAIYKPTSIAGGRHTVQHTSGRLGDRLRLRGADQGRGAVAG